MCETNDLYVIDTPSDPRNPELGEVPILHTFEDIIKHFAPIQVDCSQGWDITPPGQACWKVVGFHVTVGDIVIKALVNDREGRYIRKKLVNFRYPTAPAQLAGGGPHLYFKNGFSIETKWEGNGAQHGTQGSDVAPGKPGVFSVWVNIDPGQINADHEWVMGGQDGPKYSDAVHGLGWRGKTNHLIVNPIFQDVVKTESPPPQPPTPSPDPPPSAPPPSDDVPDEDEPDVPVPETNNNYLSIVVDGQELGRIKFG